MAVVHDGCVLLTTATPATSPVNSKGSNGAAERAGQSVEGMARSLRLDLLARNNVAAGSDLPITSGSVRHAALLLSHFKAGSADCRKKKNGIVPRNPTCLLCFLSPHQ